MNSTRVDTRLRDWAAWYRSRDGCGPRFSARIEAVEKAVAALGFQVEPRTKDVIVRYYLNREPLADIGQDMGISYGKITSLFAMAIADLRELIPMRDYEVAARAVA